jgi:hypothetical protein
VISALSGHCCPLLAVAGEYRVAPRQPSGPRGEAAELRLLVGQHEVRLIAGHREQELLAALREVVEELALARARPGVDVIERDRHPELADPRRRGPR